MTSSAPPPASHSAPPSSRDPLDPHLPTARLLELQQSDDPQPSDDEAEHLLVCDRCTIRLEGAPADETQLLEDALTALRDSIVDVGVDVEAGATRLLSATRRPKERFFSSYRMGATLGFVALAAGALLALSLPGRANHRDNAPALGHATATLAPDAHLATAQAGADEILTLTGEATLSVSKIPRGERFRLRAGTDELEVHGTRFLVRANEAGLERVAVEEGIVEVRPSCCQKVFLRAGESWDRATASTAPPTPPTDTSPALDTGTAPPGTPSVSDAPGTHQLGDGVPSPGSGSATGPAAGSTSVPSANGAQLLADGTAAYDGGRYGAAAGLLDRAVAAEPKASWAPDARTLAGTARVLASSPAAAPSLGVSVRSFENAAVRADQLGKSALAAAARLGAARHLPAKLSAPRYCALSGDPALPAAFRAEAKAKCVR